MRRLIKLANRFLPRYPDSSPGVPKHQAVDEDEAGVASRRENEDKVKKAYTAYKKGRDKKSHIDMSSIIPRDHASQSANLSVNDKDLPMRMQ